MSVCVESEPAWIFLSNIYTVKFANALQGLQKFLNNRRSVCINCFVLS